MVILILVRCLRMSFVIFISRIGVFWCVWCLVRCLSLFSICVLFDF